MVGIVFFIGGAAAYAIASIPVGGWITSAIHHANLSFGPKTLALARVLLDIGKGAISIVIFCEVVGHQHAQYGALFAYVGHRFPICPKCQGGNGIGLLLGAMIALHPIIGLVALMSWLFTYYVYRYASMAALVSAAMTPIVASLVGLGIELHILFVIAGMIFVQQRGGLIRLMEGDEKMVAWD